MRAILNNGLYRVNTTSEDANGFLTTLEVGVKNNKIYHLRIDAYSDEPRLSKVGNETYNYLMEKESGTSYDFAVKDLESQVFLKLTHYDELKDEPFLRVKGARFLTKDVQELYVELLKTDILEVGEEYGTN